METDWPAVLSAASGAFSAIAALAAVAIAIRNERRSREITKAQMYLTLREGFLAIYKELGELEDAQDPQAKLRRAREAYWHHAYDEWRLSRMAPRELGDLWTEFFRKAVQSGYAHQPLRRTFDDLRGDKKAGFGAYAKDFIADFLKNMPPELWDDLTPRSSDVAALADEVSALRRQVETLTARLTGVPPALAQEPPPGGDAPG